MSPSNLRIRRATTDDFQSLRALWDSMRFPTRELERRLTEFQVVEGPDGGIVGAIGLQIAGSHALLHSEGYTDFALADEARQLLWERIQTVATHHGVFRLWTRETSPFWTNWGFHPADADMLGRLPPEWKHTDGRWLTYQLKDEDAIARLNKEITALTESEKKRTAEMTNQARTMTTAITVILFLVGTVLIGVALLMLIRRGPSLPGH